MRVAPQPRRRVRGDRVRAAWALWALTSAACVGPLLSPPPEGAEPGPGPEVDPESPVVEPPSEASRFAFACVPGGSGLEPPLRRLGRIPFERAYRAALSSLLGAAAEGVIGGLDFASIPLDLISEDEDYAPMVNGVGRGHVEAYVRLAEAVRVRLVETAAGQAALGECLEMSCLQARIAAWGEEVFRRPLTASELDFLGGVYGAEQVDAAAFADVVAVMLASPDFIYRLETETDLGSALATRLSFHFWGSPPDEILLEAARTGALETEAGYRVQVTRVFSDPRTRAHLREFFHAWLELQELPRMDAFNDRPDFRAYAGAALPSSRLRGDLIDDVLTFVDRKVFDDRASLADLFVDDTVWAPTAEVAALYGAEWRDADTPLELSAGQRAGLLSRPALLAYNQATTRPIMRGVLSVVRIAGNHLELPENMEDIQVPQAEPNQTTREKIRNLTEVSGCVSCHALINGFGYALESYDALGRYRASELRFDPETGAPLSELPLDLSAMVFIDGRFEAVDGPLELSRRLSRSEQVKANFARHYFRFAFGRPENASEDGCALEALRTGLSADAPLVEVLEAVAYTEAFRNVTKDSDG